MSVRRILIIDDEEAVVGYFVYLLSQNGYHCETAGNVADGLEAAERFHPDVILFDLEMPGDGRRFPTLLGGDRRPVLIAASGSLSGETENQLRADGVEYVLLKPFGSSVLLGILAGCSPRPP